MLIIGVSIYIAGMLMLVATLYQEEIPTEPEIPHMEIPRRRVVWRTRNLDVTNVGLLLVCVGASLSGVGACRLIRRR